MPFDSRIVTEFSRYIIKKIHHSIANIQVMLILSNFDPEPYGFETGGSLKSYGCSWCSQCPWYLRNFLLSRLGDEIDELQSRMTPGDFWPRLFWFICCLSCSAPHTIDCNLYPLISIITIHYHQLWRVNSCDYVKKVLKKKHSHETYLGWSLIRFFKDQLWLPGGRGPHRFNFQRPHGDGGELVVLDRKEAIDAEPEAIPHGASPIAGGFLREHPMKIKVCWPF